MPVWKSDDAKGRKARECCQFGGFDPINPKFDSSKDKTWELFDGWYYLIAPIPSHHAQKIVPLLVLGVCTWLPRMPKREFWDFIVLLDTKNIPSKMSIFKINFLCAISLTSASISTKNELLTHWIDKDMKFWSMAPSANPLKHPKCITFGTFLRPSIPPYVI